MKVRSKYAFIVAGVWLPSLALAIAAYLLILEPQIRRGRQFDVQLAEAKNLYRVACNAANEENQVRLERSVQTLNDRVSDFVLRADVTSDLAFELARLADETGVESFVMKPKKRPGPDPAGQDSRLEEERITVSFTGPFHEFATLLNALERRRPVLLVETFAINRPRTPSAEPQVSMQLAVLAETAREG